MARESLPKDFAFRNGDYSKFLRRKLHEGAESGFEPTFLPDCLFDFQKHLTEWAVRKGRAAVFADCGMGKTLIELVWAENVVRHTNKPALILAPLAVSAQTVREAEKFGLECHRSHEGELRRGVNITNYERLHFFDPGDFAGVVCDESSILKSFDGVRRGQITDFMRKVPYRLLCTATAAPNDYVELGTSSEALGYLGHMDMLTRFFKNDNNNVAARRMYGEAPKWRFKGHAQLPFWRWVCSWARALRKPSDLGFNDDGFILPPLVEREHEVKAVKPPEGMLFALPAGNLRDQREERRRTIQERCGKVAELVSDTGRPALVWCHLNPEGDLLESLIPDAVQVAGSDREEVKEERLMGFAQGDIRALVTKPKIGAWGMNFQHCSHITFFPSHSFEQYYQAVRRCWRFGQEHPVKVDIVSTHGELAVMANLKRKAESADHMFTQLVAEMNRGQIVKSWVVFDRKEEVPTWL